MNIIQLFGWIGTILLSVACFPQLYQVVKAKNAIGLHWYYLILVLVGMSLMLIYVLFTTFNIQLILSYTIQLLIFSIIIYYKKYPKNLI